MAHLPEAECLLATGAMYSRRIGLKPQAGDLIFAGLKRGAFSLYFGDAPIYHFDLEGRWQRAFVAGSHFRKGLDNSVVVIERIREGANLVLHRRRLSDAEVASLDIDMRCPPLEILSALQDGTSKPVDPPSGVRPMELDYLKSMLETIASWDASAWKQHADRAAASSAPSSPPQPLSTGADAPIGRSRSSAEPAITPWPLIMQPPGTTSRDPAAVRKTGE